METNMYESTLLLLNETDIPLSVICRETGLKSRWLRRLLAGDFSDPGVNKIQRLHDYLQNQRQRRDRTPADAQEGAGKPTRRTRRAAAVGARKMGADAA